MPQPCSPGAGEDLGRKRPGARDFLPPGRKAFRNEDAARTDPAPHRRQKRAFRLTFAARPEAGEMLLLLSAYWK